MLRCDLELTAYVVFAKFCEKFIIRIIYKIIVSYPASHKDLFYSGNTAELSEKLKVILV